MKLIFGDELIFYTSRMYETCLHCHWLCFFFFHIEFQTMWIRKSIFILKDYTMVHKDLLDMNVSWLSEDLELIEYHPDIFTSSIGTAARIITLAIAIIVHRAFYKLMKRLPGRAVNAIIYPNMVRCREWFPKFANGLNIKIDIVHKVCTVRAPL